MTLTAGAKGRARAALLTLAIGGYAGCAASNQIVEDRFDISEASGTPDISEAIDIGGGDVPLSGTLSPQPSDGVAVIGEALWIRGSSFGRQPTVVVGGRPAAVLGRTRDGGIVVRVPPSTPTGSVTVAVSNEVGKGERQIAVRRYAAVLAAGSGQLGWVQMGPEGPSAGGKTPAPGAEFLAMSAEGRAAYVAPGGAGTKGAKLGVIEVPAPGAPKQVYELDLGAGPVVALAAAARAPVLAVVRRDDVLILDTTSPLRPARSTPRALPPEVRKAGIVAADVSPDGKLLAVATEAGNQILLLDLVPRGRAPLAGSIAVLPEVRESTLVDVAFSPTGDTLWVLSGDTPRSRAVGPQPTEVRAIRLASDPQSLAHLDIARVVRLDDASAPARLGVGRSLPLASGGAIRLPPERGTVFVSASSRASTGDTPAAGTAPSGSGVFRVGSEDTATVVIAAGDRLGFPDLTFDGRWLMAPASGADGSVRVLTVAVDGRPSPTPRPVVAIPAEAIPAGAGEAPPAGRAAPQLRIQP